MTKIDSNVIARLRSPQAARDFYQNQFELKDTTRWQSTKEPCPFCGIKNGKAFRISLGIGAFCCYACGAKGGNVIDFVMQMEGVDFKLAIARLDRGISSPSNHTDWAMIRAMEEAERQREEVQAAVKAVNMWSQGKENVNHPYLIKKRIRPHGTRVLGNILMVPLYSDGILVNIQRIFPYGSKYFLTGGKVDGCFFGIGQATETILIAEGLGAAASLHEHTGKLSIVSFGLYKLTSIAKIIRGKYPDAKIIVCGDNDGHGKGQRGATEAALAVNGKVSIPPIMGDWNDWYNREGAP